ncbi:hypothetical protein OPQ81_007787 [Rhizoctonia solani]|nr:hypothetical protein OPQ81_007787 [Rhizoctonia solani]
MEINGTSQLPVEARSPSPGLLRSMRLGAGLRIELICLIQGAPVPPMRARIFPFISAILASLQEVTFGAMGWYQMNEHDKSDGILQYLIALRRDSETSVAPRFYLRSLELTLSLPASVHEFAHELHAFNVYSVLENPPLPLQLCFDGLRSQLQAHLTSCYPSLFGEHAKTLRKNTEYLDSILTSLSRIFDRSANDSLKRRARLHKLSLLENVRSRLQNQPGVLNSTRASIEDSMTETEERTVGLAHSINQDICSVWLQLQPSEKQGNLSVPVWDNNELEIHEDLPESALEDEDSRGDPIIDTDSEGDISVPWGYHSPGSTRSILDMDSPPISPN